MALAFSNPIMRRPLVEVHGARLDFPGGGGVCDLSFRLPPGIILGLIGPSGCGKTTTIRLLTGIYRPQAGEVHVLGKRPADFRFEDKVRIGYVPQHFILYPHLSAEENLHFMGGMYGLAPGRRKERIAALLELFELGEARQRLGRHLSGGMKRRLMLAGALLHDPELILADEPTSGIDPILRARIWKNFRQLRDEGRSLLVATQYVGEAAYCDQVAVMRRGRLITIDTPDGLRRQAMGGDVLHLQVEAPDLSRVMAFLQEIPLAKKVEPVGGEVGGLYIYVSNGHRELPALLALLKERLNLVPRTAEHAIPPFDEVFVRLIQALEGA